MGFDYTYLQYIRRKDSPTDELLTSWGNQNHSVDDLFVLLSKMQHYRAMSLLKDLGKCFVIKFSTLISSFKIFSTLTENVQKFLLYATV